MYDRTTTTFAVNEARFEMFAGSNAGMMPFNQEKQRS
jgi:hypothetical protein